MATSHPVNASRNTTATPMVAPNAAAALSYNNIPNTLNTTSAAMPMILLPQQQQYQQPQLVSPVVSPVPPRDQIALGPNHPVHLPINNGIAWQHPQMQQPQHQHPQLNPTRSQDAEEYEKNDASSDVSSIPWGSIRPDPNYDPAKDPLSPERIDEPFVAPAEITIRVVKSRRRKTMGTSVYSTTTNNTNITPPYSSSIEEDKQLYSKLYQSPDLPTTQTGNSSIPMLGMISSFASDDTNSFSGAKEQAATAEDLMHLEEDLLGLQMQGQEDLNNEESKQRKGMVRREFNRRILRFKKKKEKGLRNEIGGENNINENDGDDEASGNKIIIQVNGNDNTNKPKKTKSFNPMDKFAAQFHGKINHHRRNNSMQMIVGQENGC